MDVNPLNHKIRIVVMQSCGSVGVVDGQAVCLVIVMKLFVMHHSLLPPHSTSQSTALIRKEVMSTQQRTAS